MDQQISRYKLIETVCSILADSMPQDGTTPTARIITRCTISAIAEDFSRALNLNHEEKQDMFTAIGLEH